MPYSSGKRLPGERASRLGHLDVLNSPLVKQLIKSFEEIEADPQVDKSRWNPLDFSGKPLDLVFAVDGSFQVIQDEVPPHKALAFIKTALMVVDQVRLARVDKQSPHPFALRDIMSDSAIYHATVFPLRHVKVPGTTVYHTIRQIIYESIKDPSPSIKGEIMETLKWIAFEKWSGQRRQLPFFECPHPECASGRATLDYDLEEGNCPACGKTIYLTDMLGFHHDMVEDSAADVVATSYMGVHETLLLFTGIRHFWETNREVLHRCLFLKDGPLQIRAQYSKLVQPIRRFLIHAYNQGYPVSILGQEKTGSFVEHFDLIKRAAPENTFFIPDHHYICEQIQHRPAEGAPYGKDTNYGAKVFINVAGRHFLVLSVPVTKPMRDYIMTPDISSLIGYERMIATLPPLLSSRHENALVPIELAHSIASLSTYPSAQVLRLFADAEMGGRQAK